MWSISCDATVVAVCALAGRQRTETKANDLLEMIAMQSRYGEMLAMYSVVESNIDKRAAAEYVMLGVSRTRGTVSEEPLLQSAVAPRAPRALRLSCSQSQPRSGPPVPSQDHQRATIQLVQATEFQDSPSCP